MANPLEDLTLAISRGDKDCMDPVWEGIFHVGPHFCEDFWLLAFEKGYWEICEALLHQKVVVLIQKENLDLHNYLVWNNDLNKFHFVSKYGSLVKFNSVINGQFVDWCFKNMNELIKYRNSDFKLGAFLVSVEKTASALKHVDRDCLEAALISSVYRGNVEIVEMILDHGIGVETTITGKSQIDNDGKSILHIAAEQGHVHLVKLLIEKYNADVNFKTKSGFITPLHLAAKSGNCEVLRVLLDAGANVKDASCRHISAFQFADLRGCEESVELLLNRGVDINEENVYDETGLSIAVAKRRLYASKTIIRAMMKMKCEGKFVSEKNLIASKDIEELCKYQVQCEDELKSLCDKKFINSRLSYFSILKIGNSNQLAALANNENIVQAMELIEFEKEFPIYGKVIVEKFESGVLRKNLFDQLCKLFTYVACRNTDRLPKLPYTCVYQILLYLKTHDCDNLLYL